MLVQNPLRNRWPPWLDQGDQMPKGFVASASADPFSGRWDPLDEGEFQVPPNIEHDSALPLKPIEWARVRVALG